MWNRIQALLALVLVTLFVTAVPSYALNANAKTSGFLECFDHGNNGAAPAAAPTRYKIKSNAKTFPYLVPGDAPAGAPVFKLIIEDVRFTTYKCWDKNKNLSGFDIEMMTQAAYNAGYRHIEFVLTKWTDVVVGGKKQLSLLSDLNNGVADAVSAGMSITPERLALVDMVGPIYKAGKKLMARNDNAKITPQKLAQMLAVPAQGFDALKGLSVVVSGTDIRGAFFRKLSELRPDLVEYLKLDSSGTGFLPVRNESEKLAVYEIDDYATLNGFVDNHMSTEILGKKFDLTILDTGSYVSLVAEGKLGRDTQLVTGNLAADPATGAVFGLGDGVSFRKNDVKKKELFQSVLAKMIRSKRINELVTKWFQDENAADHKWAEGCGLELSGNRPSLVRLLR